MEEKEKEEMTIKSLLSFPVRQVHRPQGGGVVVVVVVTTPSEYLTRSELEATKEEL